MLGLKEFLQQTYFLYITLFAQFILILLFGLFTTYDTDNDMSSYYAPFVDVHVMMFIGFGFLYTYLGKYSYNSISFNLLLGALVIQWSILNLGFWENVAEHHFSRINLRIQLYGAVDVGGSMYIHVFGAYFGLTVAWFFSSSAAFNKKNNHSLYNSNLFSILGSYLLFKYLNTDSVGTIFLWMFWPSFNCALATSGQAHRTVINTLLSLCCSCVVTFCWSGMYRNGKFDIV